MSTTDDSSLNKIFVIAQVTVKPGKGDELQRMLTNSLKYSNSDEEPGCLTFRCSRYGDTFVVFEEYSDNAAKAKHYETAPYKAISAVLPELLAGKPTINCYEEFTSQ